MKKLLMMIGAAVTLLAPMAAATADLPPSTKAGAYAEHVLAFIETRPGDYDAGLATIDTVSEVGFVLIIL